MVKVEEEKRGRNDAFCIVSIVIPILLTCEALESGDIYPVCIAELYICITFFGTLIACLPW